MAERSNAPVLKTGFLREARVRISLPPPMKDCAIILIPGAFYSPDNYQTLLSLLKKNHKVYTFWPDPQSKSFLKKNTQSLKKLIEKTSQKNIILIGHSLGGYLSLCLSHHPKVKKLVLINPLGEPLEKPTSDILSSFLLKKTLKNLLLYKKPKLLLKTHNSALRNLPLVRRQKILIRILKKGYSKSRLVKKPTLIIHSQKDEIISLENLKKLQKKIKSSKLKTVPNNHDSPLFDPQPLFKKILPFLKN